MAAAVADQQPQEWRVDEEEEEEPLKGRQHKTPTSYAEAAAMEPTSNGNGHGLIPPAHHDSPEKPEPESEPAAEDEEEVSGTFPSNGSSTNGEAIRSITTTISRTVVFPTQAEVQNKEVVLPSTSAENGAIGEIRQQETEVVLESVYQKPATQEFFCPNCQSCIQKVILRDREGERLVDTTAAKPVPSKPQRVYTFRCAECFSFLIPIGNWIFGGRGQDDDETLTDQVDGIVPQGTPAAPSIGAVPVQGKPPSAVTGPALPDSGSAPLKGSTAEPKPASSEVAAQGENGHVSVVSRDPSATGFTVGFSRPDGNSESSGNIEPHQQPANDSDKVEVVIDGGKVSVDVTKDKNKGAEGILGVLISKLPGMRAKQIGELNQGLLDVIEDARNTGTQLPVSSPTTGEAAQPVPGTSEIVVVTSQPPVIPPPRVAWEWDILKSIVYGGLAELIISLSVVTSAASADTETLKILAIGVANLIGGIFLLTTNIWELRCELPRQLVTSTEVPEEATEADRYCDNLGKRTNFKRHTLVAVLSFLIFGLIPPVVYGFSFKESDDRDYKIAATAAASLVCVFLLAIGKAHVQKPPKTYFKSVAFYVTAGVMASGASFLAGELFKKVMDDLGTFQPVAEAPPAANWASY